MMINKIIVISGKISSGKSFLANLLSEEYQIPIASFGSYLKYYCESNNKPVDRKTLQDTGEQLVVSNPNQFLQNVISHFIGNSDCIIIEGVRHKVIFDEIKNLTEKVIALYTEADLETRYNRYILRSKDSDVKKTFEEFTVIENHSVEKEIEDLIQFDFNKIETTKDYWNDLKNILKPHF